MLLGVVLALVVPEIDRTGEGLLPPALHTTGETARATLATLSGAMFTVTGIVFSTTIVALSITSAQLGPRLLRNFLKQMVTQITLGICLATSVYCLILLRRVDKYEGDFFVPHASLLLASAMALVTLITIIYFIHRVAHSMQAQNVVADVADDLDEAIERLFPERLGQPYDKAQQSEQESQERTWREVWERFDEGEEPKVVRASADGYLQAIDVESVMKSACRHDLTLRLRVRPGDYLCESQPLVDAAPAEQLSDDDELLISRSFLVGNQRTTQQDVECAVNDLVEIALRALSPGVNDPFTAIACIDRLSSTLRRLATRQPPPSLRYDGDNQLRVVVKPWSFSSILDAAFDQLRQHSKENVAVTTRLLEALTTIADDAVNPSQQNALRRQAEMIIEGARSADGITEDDRKDIENRYKVTLEAINQSCEDVASGEDPPEEQASSERFDGSSAAKVSYTPLR